MHRAIRHVVRSGTAKDFGYSFKDMMGLGEHCSMTERRADDATRNVTAWLKCEYMQEHVGENFAGIITGVTGFGLFVELSDIYVEGLVHITALTSDYYHFDPVSYTHLDVYKRQLRISGQGETYGVGKKMPSLDRAHEWLQKFWLDRLDQEHDILGHPPVPNPHL